MPVLSTQFHHLPFIRDGKSRHMVVVHKPSRKVKTAPAERVKILRDHKRFHTFNFTPLRNSFCDFCGHIKDIGIVAALYDESSSLADLGCAQDRKSTRLNSSHVAISYAVFCLKKKISVI